MKGVPNAEIAAATSNPELMKQLIIQHYGLGSARAPANIGYAPYGSTGGGQFGYSGQRVDPQTGGLDDDRARRHAPAWGRFISDDRTGLSAGDINLYRNDANNPVEFNNPSGLFVGRDRNPVPPPGLSPPRQQVGIMSNKSSYCRTMHDIFRILSHQLHLEVAGAPPRMSQSSASGAVRATRWLMRATLTLRCTVVHRLWIRKSSLD
jgi:RHS repeat-associated protein